jgi:hypothetical protein
MTPLKLFGHVSRKCVLKGVIQVFRLPPNQRTLTLKIPHTDADAYIGMQIVSVHNANLIRTQAASASVLWYFDF